MLRTTSFILSCTLALGAEAPLVPWSFSPLKRPSAPAIQRADWPRQELDQFVLAKLEQAAMQPNPDAPRATLLRRATLDLHGLLPTVEELDAFLKDGRSDEDAFAAVVDRLLKSPRYGERWARHWLDVVRYADSTGRSWNAPLIYAFRYRDWVIDSLNADLPYTDFMAQQVAGDLLPAKDAQQRAQQLIATGMLTLGSMDLTEGQYEMAVMNLIDDQIDVTTRAFLGLTIACARCHDHKYDPVKQSDYYALAGLFYSSRTLSGTAGKSDMGQNLYVDPDRLVTLTQPTSLLARPATGQTSSAASMTMSSMEMVGEEQVDNKGYRIGYAYDPRLAMAVVEDEAKDCPIRIAGDAYDEGTSPKRGAWEIPLLPPMPRVPAGTSGRLQLAQWLTTTTHPLTSRVMVNRIWSHLMGKGLVSTPDDFGITGEKPTHPELLDHLAIQFVKSGWSMKEILRSIMLSRTYRQSSAGTHATALQKDPDNTLHWRNPPRRVEVEVIRDSLLQAAGELSFDRPVGIQIAGNGGKGNTARTRSLLGVDSSYRTIYLPVLRDLLPSMLETWDFPNPSQIKGQREVTTVAPQALFMMNDEFSQQCAEGIARSLPDGDSRALIRSAYRLLLSREPLTEEVEDAQAYAAAEGDLTSFIQCLISSAEYRYAW